ncbi:MAG: SUMF1/EgtB/PvdO family nonheme iron enzyme [Pyrinomonadaceae bacterium]
MREDAPGNQIAAQLEAVRADTLRLFDLVPREADLRESPGFGFRPVLWHLAHIGVFEAYWILQRVKGDAALDERYERVFDPIATPREESKNLPARREMEAYLMRVRSAVLNFLESSRLDGGAAHPLLRRGSYVFQLILEHERQHQETLAYLLQMLDPAKKSRPADSLTSKEISAAPTAAAAGDMVDEPAGEVTLGAPSRWKTFVYDNELPAREVFVPAFRIARLLESNERYANFVNEGGYARREWWGAEGWAWREREGWSHPLYWRPDGAGGWLERGMFGESALDGSRPVTGISWYEAEAFARFMGARLPTEAEWERAASAWDQSRETGARGVSAKPRFAWGDEEPSDVRCNYDFRYWGTTAVGRFPAGASASGCQDLTGNLWEWTSDAFAGYPGFEADPYPEYSESWFDGDHRVLKGGSWATRAPLLRTSFRNFFRRHFRIAFAGIRLAE